MKLFSDSERRELKYYIHPSLISAIVAYLEQYIVLDPHAAQREDHDYTIRSIYFDTRKLDFYYDKLDGLEVRKKVRLRVYNEFQEGGYAFLEIKRKYRQAIVKERTKVPFNEVERICVLKEDIHDHLPCRASEAVVRNRFLYNLQKLGLEPSILITYEREAYIGRMDNTARVTFDKNVRALGSPGVNELYRDNGFEDVTNGQCILELKFSGFMPKWMRSLVGKFEIRRQSISKYCLGLDVCRSTMKTES